MGKLIDITGQTFGDLTVLERAGSTKDKKALWLCKCSCGNTRTVMGKLLRNGSVTHCGCKNKTTVNNILNKKFDRLTVIERAGSDSCKKVLWKCKCECGNEVIVRGSDLLKGTIHSCGCYKTELLSKDLTGNRYGLLTVIKRGQGKNNQMTWICECECGQEIEVTTNHLTTGNTQSCGCLSSKGEKQIVEWLQEKNIHYIRQFVFPDLVGKNNHPLRFDFAILNNQKELLFLLEYQGIQHTKNIYNLSEEEYQYSLKRDNMKREYCNKKQIPLIEINYDENIVKRLEEIFYENKRNHF